MKKFIILCILPGFIFFDLTLNAQNKSDKPVAQKFGIYSSFGANDVFTFESLDGNGSHNGDGFFAFGANYIYNINRRLDFETGLEYAKHNLIFDPPYNGEGWSTALRKENVELLTFPITVRVNFGKYFYINGGLLLDFDVSKENSNSLDDQNGIGTVLGVGMKYDFNYGISIYVNPYLRIHSLLPFSSDKQHHERLFESGIRIGLTYSFGK